MARQLPGLYWDDEKQRYFPILSQPQQPRQSNSTSQSIPRPIAIKRRLAPHRTLSDLRSVLRTARKDALIHQMQSSQFLLTDKVTHSRIPPEGFISAFHWQAFVGDTHGWFYSSVVDTDRGGVDVVNGWRRQFKLSSEVSSIGISSSTCVATSFGPQCEILCLPLDSVLDSAHISRIDSRIVHDVWTADLQGSRLVLGANKQAVVIEDIAVSTSLRRLPTQSDVFALAQRESALYTGLRNGGILQFDTRIERSCGYPLFDRATKCTSSITALRHLRDYQLLVGFIDGGISAFDLRFPIGTPLMTFTGNNNSYTVKLPLVTDPHEKLLFAAGQDNRVRIWSLMTGGPALDPGGACSTNQTVFQHIFEHRIAALQVVEEREGICLWAASGRELYRCSLGHRPGIEVHVVPDENMSSSLINMIAS